jgi:L-threonylcarbamoyladenylate synthase
MQQSALFLDRDGTLIEDVGHLSDIHKISFIPGVFAALRALQEHYALFVVSNQSGIAQGLLSRDQVDAVNRHIDAALKAEGITIGKWYICPHSREDNCPCMKPAPAFLQQAAEEFQLDLGSSFVIGDHPHDPATADGVGAFGLYVLTGHGMRHLAELPSDRLVFHNLPAAGEWILQHPQARADLDAEVARGAAALRAGKLTVFPTETVYGLGADALNPDGVASIFEAKQRPLHDPLIVHVAAAEQVEALVTHIPDKARQLIEHFWPGPLTIVLPKSTRVPDIVTAGNSTVAIRMPANPLALQLIRTAGVPVAAPSANLFGRTSPTTARHVQNQLSGSYAALIDGGTCRVGVESTVLSLTGDSPLVLRAGGLAQEEIEGLIGPVMRRTELPVQYDGPGMLPDHYAPSTPLRLVEDIENYMDSPAIGKLCFQHYGAPAAGAVRVLSPQGDLHVAAINLYHAMQELDALGLELIVAEKAPNYGLGRAVNDRLEKAAQKG